MKVHTDAVKARILTIDDLAGKVFVSSARKSDGKLHSPPYVLIHPARGTDDTDRLAAPKATRHPRFVLHAVGSSGDTAQLIAEAIEPLFVVNGVAIQVHVAGETGSGLFWESPIPVQQDPDVPDRFYQVIDLGWTSQPAEAP